MNDVFAALGDVTRLELLRLISRHGGSLSVFELQQRVNEHFGCNLAQPTISHHLRILSDAGLIEGKHESYWKYYRLKSEALVGAIETIQAIAR